MSDAVKYFQKNGLERSKELVEMGFGFCSLEDGLSFHTDQLKQLVESHELVEKLGGIDKCKGFVQVCFFKGRDKYGNRLKQAIADVESCKEAGKRLEVNQ